MTDQFEKNQKTDDAAFGLMIKNALNEAYDGEELTVSQDLISRTMERINALKAQESADASDKGIDTETESTAQEKVISIEEAAIARSTGKKSGRRYFYRIAAGLAAALFVGVLGITVLRSGMLSKEAAFDSSQFANTMSASEESAPAAAEEKSELSYSEAKAVTNDVTAESPMTPEMLTENKNSAAGAADDAAFGEAGGAARLAAVETEMSTESDATDAPDADYEKAESDAPAVGNEEIFKDETEGYNKEAGSDGATGNYVGTVSDGATGSFEVTGNGAPAADYEEAADDDRAGDFDTGLVQSADDTTESKSVQDGMPDLGKVLATAYVSAYYAYIEDASVRDEIFGILNQTGLTQADEAVMQVSEDSDTSAEKEDVPAADEALPICRMRLVMDTEEGKQILSVYDGYYTLSDADEAEMNLMQEDTEQIDEAQAADTLRELLINE